jgi:hypothetical protein
MASADFVRRGFLGGKKTSGQYIDSGGSQDFFSGLCLPGGLAVIAF